MPCHSENSISEYECTPAVAHLLRGDPSAPYDRTVVSDTFTIDKQILEKTLEFAPGEWLLSSFIATGMENVPIFIRADNAETEVEKTLNKLA